MKYSSHKGIIYRIYNSNSVDKIVSLIDVNGKKIKAIAKGVRKQTSKKAQSIDLGNYVEVKLVEGYALPIMTEIKLLSEELAWKKDFKLMLILQLICEIIDKFTHEEIEDERMFKIFYELLSQKELERAEYLVSVFCLKMLFITGHLPDLSIAIGDGDQLDSSSAHIIPGRIGFAMQSESEFGEKVNERIYKTQRYILEAKSNKIPMVSLSKKEDLDMLRLHLDWIEIALEQRLKAKEIVLGMINN